MNFNEIRSHEAGVNVPPYDRILTSILGAAAIAFGVRDRTPMGWAIAAFGGVLAARGISGRCAISRQIARRAGRSEDARAEFEASSGTAARTKSTATDLPSETVYPPPLRTPM
jgi:hypothetical protein